MSDTKSRRINERQALKRIRELLPGEPIISARLEIDCDDAARLNCSFIATQDMLEAIAGKREPEAPAKDIKGGA